MLLTLFIVKQIYLENKTSSDEQSQKPKNKFLPVLSKTKISTLN